MGANKLVALNVVTGESPLTDNALFLLYSQQIHSVALRVANQDKPSYRDSLELPVPICRQNYSLVEPPSIFWLKVDKNINEGKLHRGGIKVNVQRESCSE